MNAVVRKAAPEEVITIGVVLKRTRVTCHVEARRQIIDRHRAHAAAQGHADLDAYFHEMVGQERLEDALDYIANPWFGALTRVEFAQELIDTAFGGQVMLPWGDDPRDMTEDAFRSAVADWAYAEWESVAHCDQLKLVAELALAGDGKGVREAVAPIAGRAAARAAHEAEGSGL